MVQAGRGEDRKCKAAPLFPRRYRTNRRTLGAAESLGRTAACAVEPDTRRDREGLTGWSALLLQQRGQEASRLEGRSTVGTYEDRAPGPVHHRHLGRQRIALRGRLHRPRTRRARQGPPGQRDEKANVTVPNGLSFVRVRSGKTHRALQAPARPNETPHKGGSFGRAGWRPMPSSRTGFGSFGKPKGKRA